MSYGPPPKTPYGDQDFIKEDYVPQSSTPQSAAHGNYQAIRPSPYTQSSPYGSLPVGQQNIVPQDQHPSPELGANLANQFVNAAQSMTQEDILFMKSFRQDTFYYRILPLSTAANAAYYYYNHKKGLPHKFLKYLGISGLCYLAGIWISRGDLNRRVRASNSNTPFMQAMKKISGAPSQSNEFQDGTLQDVSPSWGTTSDGLPMRPYPPVSSHSGRLPTQSNFNNPSDLTPYNNSQDYGAYDGGGAASGELGTKPTTSYEELRARNRGMVPIK